MDLDQQIAEVSAEISLRERFYPDLVAQHRMRQCVADRRLAAMRAVLSTLTALKEKANAGA